MATIMNGFTLDTINGLGGVKGLWILGGTSGAVTSYPGASGPPGYLTPTQGATTIGASAIGGTGTWYYFAIPRDLTKVDDVLTPSQDNGTVFYAGAMTTEFQHLDYTKSNTLLTLAQNRYLKMVIQDVNGNLFAIGLNRGAWMKLSTATTGQKPGDGSTYKVSFEWNEVNPMYQFTVDFPTAIKTNQFVIEPISNY